MSSDVDGLATSVYLHAVAYHKSIEQVLDEIAHSDWDQIKAAILERREADRKFKEEMHEHFLDQETYCRTCKKLFKHRDLIHATGDKFYSSLCGWYCKKCYSEVEEINRRDYVKYCAICGKRFIRSQGGFCKDCYSKERNKEWRRVVYENARATERGLPATLTLLEWLAIVEAHGGKCAYCKTEPYTDMDHVIPVSKGGGTTADNVLPACSHCNSRKNDKDRAYLDNQPRPYSSE